MKNTTLYLGLMLTATMLFAGCVSQEQNAGNGDQNNGDQGNLQQAPSDSGGQPSGQSPVNPTDPQRRGQGGTGQGRGFGAAYVQACEGKGVGDACSVSSRNQTLEGMCTDRGGNVTCMPANMTAGPGPGQVPGMGGGFTEACQGKAQGDECTMSMRNQTVDGTCNDRSGVMNCVPNNRGNGQRSGALPGQNNAPPAAG